MLGMVLLSGCAENRRDVKLTITESTTTSCERLQIGPYGQTVRQCYDTVTKQTCQWIDGILQGCYEEGSERVENTELPSPVQTPPPLPPVEPPLPPIGYPTPY